MATNQVLQSTEVESKEMAMKQRRRRRRLLRRLLLVQDVEEDRALLDWLRNRQEHPRCAALLRQTIEWTGKIHLSRTEKADMRSLAKAQEINITRRSRTDIQTFQEALRQHFKSAMAQEKGRLACFQFTASQGASEHLNPMASDAKQVINIADVIDMQSLRQFRRQRFDMPDHLKQAIGRVAGGSLLNAKNVQEIATSSSVIVQKVIQYPGGDKATRSTRLIKSTNTFRMY
jgi:hypothetical protein